MLAGAALIGDEEMAKTAEETLTIPEESQLPQYKAFDSEQVGL